MGQFGNAAVAAAIRLRNNPGMQPIQAWNYSIAQTNLSLSTRNKYCPREAFIGLCEYGCIAQINRTKTPPPIQNNALYAWEARNILTRMNILPNNRAFNAPSQISLWGQVLSQLRRPCITHNSQMDITIRLWINGLI